MILGWFEVGGLLAQSKLFVREKSSKISHRTSPLHPTHLKKKKCEVQVSGVKVNGLLATGASS